LFTKVVATLVRDTGPLAAAVFKLLAKSTAMLEPKLDKLLALLAAEVAVEAESAAMLVIKLELEATAALA
jgi:hypothetical protein